jgi:hypothetical protein
VRRWCLVPQFWLRLALALTAVLVVALTGSAAARAGTTFTVTTTADSGPGSLRQAILDANANAGADTIAFALPGTGTHLIELLSQLPPITDPVVIDGTTQSGYAEAPVVEVRPAGCCAGAVALVLRAGHSTLKGLSIVDLEIDMLGADILPPATCDCGENTIEDDYIGLEPDGTVPETLSDGTHRGPAGGWPGGIVICGGCTTGSTVSKNRILDNVVAGIGVFGPGAVVNIYAGSDGNVVAGNKIGTNPQGTGIIPPYPEAITINTSGNVVGESGSLASIPSQCTGSCNLVAGEIQVIGFPGGEAAVADNKVVGNFVGTDVTGESCLDAACDVGGSISFRSTSGAEQQIAHNLVAGFVGTWHIMVETPTPVSVRGNFVDTDVTGTSVLGRATVGIDVGGDTTVAGNVVAASGAGIQVQGSGNVVQGNYVGTDISGAKGSDANGQSFGNGDGVKVLGSDNVIGARRGDSAGGNRIAFNDTGIHVIGAAAPGPFAGTGNLLLSNSISDDQSIGIDLDVLGCTGAGCLGPTPNDDGPDTDSDFGGNGLQNFPVITSAVSGAGETTVTYSLNSHANTSYHLEFFANDVCGSSGFGEGKTLIGSTDITTDASGNYSGTASFPTPAGAGRVITATATDPGNNTSEFSACRTAGTGTGATLIVEKQTLPDGDPQSFSFTGAASGSISDGGTLTVTGLAAGDYQVSELVPSGWDLGSIVCTDGDSSGDLSTATATFRLAVDEAVRCTFTDVKRGSVRVVKTVSGSPIRALLPANQQSFAFQLRQNASTTSAGTLLEQADANVANSGVVTFATKLVAGSTYQLCETVMPGWRTSLTSPFVLYNASGDNSTLCTNFSVGPGEARSITVDNQPPPGGLARTIGFWKNWASCSGSSGNQRPVLDQTLAAAEPAGITIGTLTLHGSTSSPNSAPDCLKAVRLLNKSTIDTGKKMASDPAFSLAAQLLAADLNVKAGALTCPNAISAINDAQALLATVHFNGITHDKLSATQTTQANSLGTTLDRYNNNLLC